MQMMLSGREIDMQHTAAALTHTRQGQIANKKVNTEIPFGVFLFLSLFFILPSEKETNPFIQRHCRKLQLHYTDVSPIRWMNPAIHLLRGDSPRRRSRLITTRFQFDGKRNTVPVVKYNKKIGYKNVYICKIFRLGANFFKKKRMDKAILLQLLFGRNMSRDKNNPETYRTCSSKIKPPCRPFLSSELWPAVKQKYI